jgi:nuclear pore complex protein Nup107
VSLTQGIGIRVFVNQDGRRLGDYLWAMRQAILFGPEGGGSGPFKL